MQPVTDMNTVSEILEKLRLKKMDNEYRWTEEGFCVSSGRCYKPEDLEIVKIYRFEGPSDPSDMAVLYIIEAKDGMVGYSLDAYGVYSNHDTEEGYDNFIRQIPQRGRDEQLLFEL